MNYSLDDIITDELYSGGLLNNVVNLEKKNKLSYTKELKRNIKNLSISNQEPGYVFGSFNYKSSLYPGDIDLSQQVLYSGSKEHVIKLFYNGFLKTIKQINSTKNYYVGETKAGIDTRYLLNDFGIWKNGILYDYNYISIRNQLIMLYERKLITLDEFNKMFDLNKNININKWDELYEMLRNLFIIRWSYEEILNDKILRGGIKIKFIDILQDKTIIKFDIHLQFNNKFIEMSNFFILIQVNKDGTHYLINLPQDYLTNIDNNLKYEIEKLYLNKQFKNYFKMCKRIFSFARRNKNQEVALRMIDILNSDAGLLYQVKSDLDTIITMLEYIKNPPIKKLINQLDNNKLKVSNITEIQLDDDKIYNSINNLTSHYQSMYKESIINKLKELKKYIMDRINNFTYRYLESINYIPLPDIFLPDKSLRKYY